MLFIGMATFTYGQYVPKGKVSKAEIALTQGKLDIAKAEIDKAFEVDAKGKVSAAGKNWFTKGKIYKAIYLDDSTDFSNLAGEEALDVAIEAFNKVKSMEKESSPYYFSTGNEVNQLYSSLMNDGAEKYNENEFEGAYTYFMTALKVEEKDTTALLYGGVAAQQADMIDEALACFQTLADNGDAKIDTYKTMIYLYRSEKEDLESVLKIVGQAMEKFPDNSEFRQERITTLIIMEKEDEAKAELESAISNDPTNHLYYYFLGYLYDQKEDTENSMAQYKKALELKPDYYEANYNLGVVYYNVAREIVSELNNLSLDEYRKKETEYVERAAVHFKEALPYFEKAVEVKPDEDIQLLETLTGVYLQLKMSDEAEALEKRIKALTGQ